ncbi:agamous-like MADS-box protein AGL23 [Carica papaya]|uniref:agamous-like MADS-box protein AGL23 n=1 Tax=Carica papaya TaxID=3649 RepID=UPI000B8D1B5C|nr:agamous-like MADS-box protein AGL23 [Carica papaya]
MVEMVKIKKATNLQVTFAKRWAGIFKKASEISTLCGAEVAVIIFSPAKKVFFFVNPSVEKLINRFSGLIEQPLSANRCMMDAHRNACLQGLNSQLNKVMKENASKAWWMGSIDDMNLSQFQQFQAALEELYENVIKVAKEKDAEEDNINPNSDDQLFLGSSSNGTGLPFESIPLNATVGPRKMVNLNMNRVNSNMVNPNVIRPSMINPNMVNPAAYMKMLRDMLNNNIPNIPLSNSMIPNNPIMVSNVMLINSNPTNMMLPAANLMINNDQNMVPADHMMMNNDQNMMVGGSDAIKD